MLHWICPECGRECEPKQRDCPSCYPETAAKSRVEVAAKSVAKKPGGHSESNGAVATLPPPPPDALLLGTRQEGDSGVRVLSVRVTAVDQPSGMSVDQSLAMLSRVTDEALGRIEAE